MLLRDFVQDWKIYEDDYKSKEINYAFNNLSISNGTKFYFNGVEYFCEISENELIEIAENIEKENSIIFPLWRCFRNC